MNQVQNNVMKNTPETEKQSKEMKPNAGSNNKGKFIGENYNCKNEKSDKTRYLVQKNKTQIMKNHNKEARDLKRNIPFESSEIFRIREILPWESAVYLLLPRSSRRGTN